MAEKKKTLLIIDANSLIHRAYHALPPLTSAKGEMVNAVYGFLLVLFKAIKEFQPDYIAAAFDVAGPTFRDHKFQEYKAKRVKAPDELYNQIPRVKEVLSAFTIPVYEKQGFEADDVIGTIASIAPKRQAHPPLETIIVSGDLDTLQLVDDHTKVYTMRKGIQDSVLYDQEAVKKRFGGLEPRQLEDYKGLRGDPSDNIPGVTGVGEKTAIQLLGQFGSLKNLYEQLEKKDRPMKDVKPKLQETLLEQKEQAFLSKELGTIQRNVPIDFRLPDLAWQQYNKDEAEALVKKLDFHSLLSRMPNVSSEKEERQGQMFPGKESGQAREADLPERIEQLYEEGVFSKEVYELEKKLAPVLVAMEKAGIQIDKPYFQSLEKDMEKELKVLSAHIHEQAKKAFNINSTQQLSQVLFEDLGVPTRGLKKTPKGVVSTASPELEKLRGAHPIISNILLWRELQKLSSTYVKPLPQMADENSRIHTHFDQLGAATGRISSSNPNLQNIPIQGEWAKRIRRGFVAEKGFRLASFDYSQIELRVAAHLANDKKMLAIFQEQADIHRMTAAEVFGVGAKEVDDEMRYRAKALNFGILYGMGAVGFAKSAGISIEEAESFIENYFARFPEILEYIEQTKEFARAHGYAQTILGRKRYLPEINSSIPQLKAAAERMAQNHPVQGSAADIMKMAMVKIAEGVKLNETQCRMLLQIHDELLFEIRDDMIQMITPRIQEIMETAYALKAPMSVHIKIGSNWNDSEKLVLT